MNRVELMGRLTRDPEIRVSVGDNPLTIASYTLAVDRRRKKNGERTADFIRCVVFGNGADFARNYLRKGTKIAVTGRIQTGSFTNKDGQKVYTTDVVVDEQEFAESKNAGSSSTAEQITEPTTVPESEPVPAYGFINIPEDMEEELPFK